jgi:transcriptional regulator with XRE-family HTH domain|nr:MAG TPA: Repressor protein CI [Caudoviricetes sp.]
MDLTKKGVKPMGQEEICAVFARNLNKLMVRENLKQSDLVLKLKVSKAQVSDWCAGKNIPRSNYLAALVDLFGCRLSELMSEKQPAPTNGDGLSEEDKRLLMMIHNLSPEDRERIVAIIEALAELE